eukprot:scaffold104680_cov23-Tisochrysis_lutea.AAC.2
MKAVTAAGPPVAPPDSRALQMAEPTTTPSAIAATSATCSGVEMPKPTASGRSVCLRMRSMNLGSSGGRAVRAPVTPVSETQ